MSDINFNYIYENYYRKSYLFVKSYVHDDFVAEDIVSETMMKLWENLKQNKVNNPQSYLFTMLRNSSLNHLKHEAIKNATHKEINEFLKQELELRLTILQALDPSEIFSSEIQEIIKQTLDSLPKRCRNVFELSRFQYKSNKEIAEIFEISVKGVDYHISLALKALRKSLADYLPMVTFFL